MLAVFIQWSERPGQGGCRAQRTVVVTRFQRFVKAGVAPMVCSQEPDTFCFCLRTRFSPDSIGYSIERFLRAPCISRRLAVARGAVLFSQNIIQRLRTVW
jgi:hypothetical protein